MPTPPPPTSPATVSAALDRLASSRARWAGALDGERAARGAQPRGLLSLLTAWRSQPVVALATGLWAAWSRRQARKRPVPAVRTTPAPVTGEDRILLRAGSRAVGAVRRHPVLASAGLALVLAWAGWRSHTNHHRPHGPL